MQYTETTLFELPLPSPLIQFKNTVISFLIPKVDHLIQDIEHSGNNSSFISLFMLLLVFFIVKSIFGGLFKGKIEVNKPVLQSNIDEEIKMLRKEIGGLKGSLKKIIDDVNKRGEGQNIAGATGERNLDTGSKSDNEENVVKLMELYRESSENFNTLTDFIINSQEDIFKELRNVKKLRSSTEKSINQVMTDALPEAEETTFIQNSQKNKRKEPEIKIERTETVEEEEETKPSEEIKEEVEVKEVQEVKLPPRPVKAPQPIRKRGVPPPPPPR